MLKYKLFSYNLKIELKFISNFIKFSYINDFILFMGTNRLNIKDEKDNTWIYNFYNKNLYNDFIV